MTTRVINPNGLALVQRWEGLFFKAYRDQAGVWTIGWGHTGGVKKGDTITRMQADQLLILDLSDASAEVSARAPLSANNQFDAMTSLTFNIGKYGFRTSTVLRKYKAGDFSGSADAFLLWDKIHVDGELVFDQGLLNRRRDERKLYLTP